MKICHMTSAHSQGDTRIFVKECSSLAKAGYEVYLVIRGESGFQNGVHIVGVGQPTGGRIFRMTSFARRVYEAALKLDADIYHFHDPELLPYGLKLHRKGKKVVFDSHEIYPAQIRTKQYLPRLLRGAIAFLYQKYEQYVCDRIDGLIYPCTLTGKENDHTPCRHMALINNVPILEELYDRYNADAHKEERSICYIGSLTRERGISNLVCAAEKADCTLYLAGDFSTPEYKEEVLSAPNAAHIQYVGKLNRDEVRELLMRMQIGMVTLRNIGQYHAGNNLATKTYEYVSLGIPVIQNHSAYNDRVMEKYRYGIAVDPDDIDEIANAIQYLLDHPEEAKQMGLNGRKAVREEFNWGVEEEKLRKLYQDILGEKQ